MGYKSLLLILALGVVYVQASPERHVCPIQLMENLMQRCGEFMITRVIKHPVMDKFGCIYKKMGQMMVQNYGCDKAVITATERHMSCLMQKGCEMIMCFMKLMGTMFCGMCGTSNVTNMLGICQSMLNNMGIGGCAGSAGGLGSLLGGILGGGGGGGGGAGISFGYGK